MDRLGDRVTKRGSDLEKNIICRRIKIKPSRVDRPQIV